MGLSNLTIFSALAQKMRWNQARQGVLAENIANADTPGYRGKDLKAFSFESALGSELDGGLKMATTNAGHLSANSGGAGVPTATSEQGYETTPDRNAVGIEGQMMKLASNQMDYQAATTLYSRSLNILKVALGRSV